MFAAPFDHFVKDSSPELMVGYTVVCLPLDMVRARHRGLGELAKQTMESQWFEGFRYFPEDNGKSSLFVVCCPQVLCSSP